VRDQMLVVRRQAPSHAWQDNRIAYVVIARLICLLGEEHRTRLEGGAYANGRGVPRDDARTISWRRKAVDAGDAGAMTSERAGVSRDDLQAVSWYRKAAGRVMWA